MNKIATYVEFDSNGEHYVYDRYSNEFLRVDNGLMVDGHIANEYIEQLRKGSEVFVPYSFPELSISKNKSLREKITCKLNRQIVQVCFITTENCNLRCKYCVYSGAYDNRRHHNASHKMTWETAQKVLNDLFSSSSINTISFYGGESLIEYRLIKKIVEYVYDVDNSIHFAMNTNLTLLNDEILSFLIKYDFAITISLDGPEDIHDLYRVTKNNKPTHTIVEQNLVHIRKQNENYFLHKVFYNVLLVPHPYSLDVVDKYFAGQLFVGVPLDSFRILTLNPEKNSFSETYNYDSFLKKFQEYSQKKFATKHIQGAKDFSEMKISYRFQVTRIQKIIFRDMRNFDAYSYYWPNGICILGLRSIIVTSNGTYYPCETLYDQQEMSIGNADVGVDNDVVVKYTKEYIEYGNKLCKKCWAFRFCSHCFSYAYVHDKYSLEKKLVECDMTRKGLLSDFKFFMEIYSQNPKAFDYLLEEKPYEKFSYMLSD